MCGRYELKASAKTLIKHFEGLKVAARDIQPRDEFFPTDVIPILVGSEQGIQVLQAQWGLVGHFLDAAPKTPLINLRSEGLPAKPFYNWLLRQKRCIVPATAYFEWQVYAGGGKQKYRISALKEQPLWLAGVFDYHPAAGLSCAMLTTDASDSISAIHKRVPVLFNHEAVEYWLTEQDEFSETEYYRLVAPAEQGTLKADLVVEPEPSPQLAFEFA